tara:strand:- start:1386 stop:1829 length:444 start_codon:yes stop_codon:yes gene_type:complete
MEQTCNKCNISKPTEDYYKDNRRKTGLQSTCKKCMIDTKKQRDKLHKSMYDNDLRPEILSRYRDMLYECLACGVIKPRTEYKDYGLKRQRAKKCTECLTDGTLYKDFDKWEIENIDREEIQMFLNHLRRVTGIKGERDLLRKYRPKT